MKYTFSLLLTLMFLVVACKDAARENTPPIDKEKMTAIMTDIHIAETYSTMVSSDEHTTNKNIDSLGIYYKSVLKHHNLTLDEFKSALDWYSTHNRHYDSVYNSVLSELSTLEGAMRGSED